MAMNEDYDSEALKKMMEEEEARRNGGIRPTTEGREGIEAPTAAPPAEAYTAKGPVMALEGFDADRYSGGHVSPKYVFGHAAEGLGVNDRDELLRRLQADKSGYFTNAR